MSTHPDHESARQFTLTSEPKSEEVRQQPAPIVCLVSDEERDSAHTSFQHRVYLAERALKEAKESGAKEITIVGHSAGGLATLAVVANEVMRRKEVNSKSEGNAERSPSLHAVLIAPAVPGETGALFSVEPTFLKIVLSDLLKRISGQREGSSYAKKVVTGGHIHPEQSDLSTLLGPYADETYHQEVLKGVVPISGNEGLNLLMYPRVFGNLKPEDWPQNLNIDVIVPEGDRWVNRSAQEKIVTNVLEALATGKANMHRVPGGHLALGKDDEVTKDVISSIMNKNDSPE